MRTFRLSGFRVPFVIAVLPLALGLVAGCSKQQETYEEVRPVRTETVRGGMVSGDVLYSGEVRARKESRLGFRIGGKITGRFVEVGDRVKAGQTLLQLDGQDAQLNVSALQAQLSAAQVNASQAKLDFDRSKQLQAQNFVSQAEVDRRQTAWQAANAQLNQAQAQMKLAGNQASYTTLVADRAGVISSIDAEVGQVVSAGQPIVRLAGDGEKEVVISIPESRVDELRKADKLAISLWAMPEQQYQGKLRELAPDTDPITRTYAARVQITNADDHVRLGMTASVAALTGSQKAVRLPLTAIFDQTGKPQVWVVDPKTSTVNLIPVKLAGIQDNRVVVTGGLGEGQQVVTAGVHLLHAGQKVRLESAVAAPAAQGQ